MTVLDTKRLAVPNGDAGTVGRLCPACGAFVPDGTTHHHDVTGAIADLRALVIALAPRCHSFAAAPCARPALVADLFGVLHCAVDHHPTTAVVTDLPHAEALRRVLGGAS